MSSQRRSVYGELDDNSTDLSNFRPVTLTVKSFFRMVSIIEIPLRKASVSLMAIQYCYTSGHFIDSAICNPWLTLNNHV